jgi:D-alanine-D-alanine ligase-like ATP-grasp enzyme
MRAVLVGIDYVKDIDGSFKILEINTNASIPNFNPLLYLNVTEYHNS